MSLGHVGAAPASGLAGKRRPVSKWERTRAAKIVASLPPFLRRADILELCKSYLQREAFL